MKQKINTSDILFLDIETVPQYKNYKAAPQETQLLFAEKTAYQRQESETPETFYERAGIWAEFGKIICISVDYIHKSTEGNSFRTRSFHGNETTLLVAFKILLTSHFNKPQHVLCGHNSKEFDFPYIARRMIINGIELPQQLNIYGKKPWEIPHLDTMELWKFGDYKHYTSLKLLAYILGIPSPKEDIDGSMVHKVYYENNDIERIVTYCERDVLTTAQVYLKLKQEETLDNTAIVRV